MTPRLQNRFCCAVALTVAILATQTVRAGGVDCSTQLNGDIDGANLLVDFSSGIAVYQNNPTGFGDRFTTTAEPTTGSELNELYLTNNASTLFVGITGNLPPDDAISNTVLIFIQTPNSFNGSTLDTENIAGASSALIGMHGVTLDFNPDYCITISNLLGVFECLLHDLSNPMSTATVLTQGVHFGVDLSNQTGVNDIAASDPLQQQINAANNDGTGFEFAIPFSMLGGIDGNSFINIQALIANGGGFISNQSLPPLNPTDEFLGTGGGAGCVGAQDPMAVPPNIIDFFNDFPQPNNTFVFLNPSGTAPGGSLDGASIPSDYGLSNRIALQNNYTCFGNAAPFSPTPSEGSEIDELFVASNGAKLFIGLTGNIPPNQGFQNTVLIFIDVNDGFGVNELPVGGELDGGPGALQGLGNVTMPAGFNPRYVIEYWRQGGQPQAFIEDLAFNNTEIALEFTTDGARHLDTSRNVFSSNLTNLLGVNNIAGDDPIQQAMLAMTAVNGLQFSVRLAGGIIGEDLGYNVEADPGIKVMAAIVGGSGFISNQFLPPLNPTTGEVRMSNDEVASVVEISDATGTGPATVLSNQVADNAIANSLERVTAISVNVNITHPNMEDLTIDLFHDASNRTVRLWDGNQSGANMQTTFATGGADLATWTAPGAGTFEVNDPVNNSLLTFNDVDPRTGSWTLFITDNVDNGSTGTLNSWSIDVTHEVGGGVDCIGFSDADNEPLNFPVEFPGLEPYEFTITPLLAGGAPDFAGAGAPGTNIPDAYSAGPVSTQNNYTCFGDAQPQGLPINSGNELDALYIKNTQERLLLGLAGNIETATGGNGYVVLIDSVVGGETEVSGGAAPPNPIGGNPNEAGSGLNGTVLDAGFTPDYALVVTEFFGGFRADLMNLQTDTNRLLGFGGFNTANGLLNPPGINEGGSELDQMFLQNDANNLYVGLTGNLEGNGNPLILFLDTAAGGSTTLSTVGGNGWPGVMAAINGEVVAAGPNGGPEYAIVLTRSGAFFDTASLVDLNNLGAAPVPIPFADQVPASDPPEFVLAPNTFVGSNDNVLGVNGDAGVPPATQSALAATAESGIIFSISRASIGSPSNGTTIGLSAGITSGGGFWSNQFLPGISDGVVNSPNVGDDGGTGVDLAAVGQTFASYALSASASQPSAYNGRDIPAAMTGGGNPIATQNNSTGFGDRSQEPFDNSNCIQIAFDNNNLEGVNACSCIGGDCIGGMIGMPELVDTGMEVDLSLADIGLGSVVPGNEPTIRVLALLTGNSGYVSNQLLPGVGGHNGGMTCNLEFKPDLSAIPGDQFVSFTLSSDTGCATCPGDVNGDNLRDGRDVQAFVADLLGAASNPCSDTSGDSSVSLADVPSFVAAILGGGC